MRNVGRYLFGLASLASGIVTLIWHDHSGSPQLADIVYAAAAAQIVGGIAIQFRPSANVGAAMLAVVYLFFALLCVPGIVSAPRVYNSWGNFFEQLSLFTGAAIAYAWLSSASSADAAIRIGRVLLGVCAVSFALEQAFYLHATATLVPTWLPPSQTFWAIATTAAFALAAIALLTNQMTLLATRLLTAMIVGFGLLVWVPLLLSDPRSQGNWSECAETFAIAGAVWILADCLRHKQGSQRFSKA
jgi:hypothetical protein